jgi:hypothetical protein
MCDKLATLANTRAARRQVGEERRLPAWQAGAVERASEAVEAYLAPLPQDRRDALEAVRRVVLEHLPTGYEEVVQYGMISYVVPLERYPTTYNGQPLAVASLANQKRHMSLYLMGVYGEDGAEEWLRERWAATGKKLDMGKSCVRFKRLDDLALDVVAEAIARTPVDAFIAAYERSRA